MADYEREILAATISKLRSKIKRFRKAGPRIGEENTKVTLVEPVLAALGWDVEEPDEVHREYRKKPQDAPVDYALCIARTPRLFVEAKALARSLDDRRWASQVIGYATVVGVEWCVLTNGDDYRLYNAHAAVDVEEKLFRSVAISVESDQELLEDTLDLLSRPRLQDKRLTMLWEAHHVDRQVQSIVERLWSKPEPSFVRLIGRHAKGLKPKEIRASLQRCRVKIDIPVGWSEARAAKAAKERPKQKRVGGRRKPTVPGLPSQKRLEVPLLREIARFGGAVETRTQLDPVAADLAEEFSLSAAQLNARTRSGKAVVWKNRIRWVRQNLVDKGDIDGRERGVWRITKRGRKRVADEPRARFRLVDGRETRQH